MWKRRCLRPSGPYTGGSPRGPTFRPHLGCLPASGGGSGPVPYRLPSAFPPGEPTIRRVRTVRLRPGVVQAVAACAASERLVSAWHAVAFYTPSAPRAMPAASWRPRAMPPAARTGTGATASTTSGTSTMVAIMPV